MKSGPARDARRAAARPHTRTAARLFAVGPRETALSTLPGPADE